MAMVKRKVESTEPAVYRTYEDYPPEDLYLYAGFDCIVTSTLAYSLLPDLINEPEYIVSDTDSKPVSTFAKSLIEVNDNITKLVFDYIIDLEINGLKYDIELNKRISEQMVLEIAELDSHIFQKIPKGTNLDSGTEVSKLLYETLGFTPQSYTKTGEPSTDGEALLTLAGLDPLNPPKDYKTKDPELQFLAYMAKRKDINSTHNTFVKTYVYDFVKKDGRIHPSYNLHGTSSFRITGDSPNLTQLPRPKHGYNIRDCFIIERGNVFIAFDFSSAEVKILGALCRDANMLKAIADGLDFHSFSASNMLGVSYEDFITAISDKTNENYALYKQYRQTAKILTLN